MTATFQEAADFRAMLANSSAPQDVKDAALGFLDKITESEFRAHCGADNTLNGAGELVSRIIEAAILGHDFVTHNGARHRGATEILRKING